MLFALAVSLAHRRDLGAGLRPAGRGPATAAGPFRSPAGLAERLQRGSLIAWATGVFFFAVAMGLLANSLQDLLEDNPALAGWINLTGTDLAGEFAAVILSFVMIAPVILGGAGVGLGVTAGTGDSAWTGEMTVAALAYLPAVLLTGGLAAALYGAAPRLTGIAWLLIVWLSVALFLVGLAGFRCRDIASG